MTVVATEPVAPAAKARSRLLTRRRFLQALGLGALGAAGTATYAVAIEPHALRVERLDIPIAGLPPAWDGCRIVHMSDLHASRQVDPALIQRAFALAAACRPAFIAITGDWVTNDVAYIPVLEQALPLIVSACPVYGTMGNHDYNNRFVDRGKVPLAQTLYARLSAAGVQMLRNASVELAPGGLRSVGMDDYWFGDFKPAYLATQPADGPTIVLSHNPDSLRELLPQRWDLLLSGHTHGGQVVLPGVGPLRLPVRDWRYYAGLYRFQSPTGPRSLYVTRGVGHLTRIRFCCPPEVTCLTLRSA